MATRPPVFSYPADPNDPLREELRRGITLPGDTFRRALAPQVRPAPALPADGDERPAWRRVLDTIQAPLNTTGAGFGAVVGGIAGLFGSDAYERAVARRADEYGIGPDADLIDSLAIAPGPGTVLAEALAPGRPETAAGRIAKNVASMAGDIVGDPANWIAGGLAGARALGSFARTGVRDVGRMAPALGDLSRGTDEVVDAVRAARSITRTEAGKQALGQFLGSATAGLVYAPDIAIGTVDSLRAAKDAYDRGDFDTAAEMAVQAGFMGGIGGLTLHGVRREAEAIRRPPRVPQPMVDTIDLVDRLVAEQSGRPRGTVFQGEIPEPPFVAPSEDFTLPPPDVWDGTTPPPGGGPGGGAPDVWRGRPPVMPWVPDVWDGPGPDEGAPALPPVWPGPTQGGPAPGGATLAPEQALAERAFLRPDMDAATAAETARRAREWRRAQSLEAQIEDMADRIASGEFAAMAERGEEPSPEDLQFRLNNADAINEALRVRQERAFLRPDPEAQANAETARLAREHLRDRAEAERPISVGRVEELDAPIGPTRIFGADAERPGKLQDPVLEAMLQERWENQRFPLQQLQARADARFKKDSKGLDNEQLQRLAGDTGVASDPLDRLLIENAHGLRVMRDHERRPDGGMRSWKEGSPFEDVPESPTEIIRAVAEDRDNPLYLKAREAAARWMDDKEIGDAVDFEAADADTSFDPDALEAQAGAPTLLTRPESGIDSLQPYQPPKTPLDELVAQRLAANAARAEAERGGFGPGRVPALSDEGTVDLADVRARMQALKERKAREAAGVPDRREGESMQDYFARLTPEQRAKRTDIMRQQSLENRAGDIQRSDAERAAAGLPPHVPATALFAQEDAAYRRAEAERRADMDAEMRMLDEGGTQPVTPQQPALPDAVRPAEPAPSERRAEPDLRARVDQFIEDNPNASREDLRAEVERLRAELDTDALTGLGSARAMERGEQAAGGIAAFDLSGLKWFNDTLGHDAGDEVLRAVGQAFREAGATGFRKSGDEFFLHAPTPEAAAEAAKRVQDVLAGVTLKWTGPDGTVKTFSGLRIDYGVGGSRGEADSALYAGREAAVARGERAPRGERPAGLREVGGPEPEGVAVRAPEGGQAGDRVPAEAVAAPEPSAEPEVRGWRPATQSAEDIKTAIRSGATARVVTATRVTVLDAKALARFEKAGGWMLRDAPSNTGRPAYRLQTGKSSVFLLPGQLQVDRAIPAPESATAPEATTAIPAPHDTRTPEAREGEVTITFPKKPDVAVRKGLKAAGFKWDNDRGTWVAPRPVAEAAASTVRAAAERGGVVRGMGGEPAAEPVRAEAPSPRAEPVEAPKPEPAVAPPTSLAQSVAEMVDIARSDIARDKLRAAAAALRDLEAPGAEKLVADNLDAAAGIVERNQPALARRIRAELERFQESRVELEQRDPEAGDAEPDEMLDADVPPDEAAGDGPALADAPGVKAGTADLIERISMALDAGEKIDNPTLTRLADEAFGGTRGQGKYDPRDAYDALEAAVNARLADEAPRLMEGDGRQGLEELRSLLRQLPRQDDRTTEQVELQQFSTPPTQAFVAARAAKIRPGEVVLEPSAGVGGLATFARAAGGEVVVNEIAPRRGGLLQMLGFEDRHSVDAELLDDLLPDDVRPSLVIMNPPFSATGGRVQRNNTEFGARHIDQALRRLEPGGRLVAIVGEGMKFSQQGASGGRGATGAAFTDWWADIMREYNVRANLGIPGDEYGKYGTTFPNQILVIDKTGPTPGGQYAERVKHVRFGLVKNLEEALDALERIDRPAEVSAATAAERPTLRPAPGRDGVADGERPGGRPDGRNPVSGGGTGGRAGVRSGRGGGVGGPSWARPEGEAPATPGGERGPDAGSAPRNDAEVGVGADRPEAPERPVLPDARGDGSGDAGRVAQKDEYVPYKPSKVRSAAQRHPGLIVEPPSMASVEPPNPTYQPAIPESVLRDGRLSDLQYEAVVYAGQRHSRELPDGTRAGFFIGDGTGVGKGREVAGVIYDNWLQGRKRAAWISFSKGLVDDSTRDLTAVAGEGTIPVLDLGDYSANDKIEGNGVLFITYNTLAVPAKGTTRARLAQIMEWLGDEPVIAFDEAHRAKNADPGDVQAKPSKQGLAVLDLQKAIPKARVVYVSATGATEVGNLAYATRLGLWAPGETTRDGRRAKADAVLAARYPFESFDDFVTSIESSGVGAKEVVSRDMKAMGAYVARSLSFDGVDYRETVHAVTPEQRQMYNTAAEAWTSIQDAVLKAMETTNTKGFAAARAKSQFWAAHQRFFKTFTTSLKIPTAIKEAEAALKRGESVVFSLIGTAEGQTDRQVAKATAEQADLDELDFSPTQQLLAYVDKNFPTQLFEEYTDPDSGQTRTRPVMDKDGRPVESKEALRMKQGLMDRLQGVRFTDSPLDQIINHFGEEAVAEVSGRKKRLVIRNGRKEYVSRAGDGVPAKRVNRAEMAAFQSGKKLVAVVSGAGSTGFSFHSDLGAKNRRRRHMFLLELPWSADQALQSMGRIHRSNQAAPPIYTLLSSDIGGERRFASTIARRLESLGALTKGERTASQAGEIAKYNFETDYGRKAKDAVYDSLMSGDLAGIGDDTLIALGFMDPKTRTTVGSEKISVPQLLNRILGLDLGRQRVIVESFMREFKGAIDRAKEAGAFDEGVADIQGSSITIKKAPQVVHVDKQTGAETRHIQLEVKRPTKPLSFDNVSWAVTRDFKEQVPTVYDAAGRPVDVRPGIWRQKHSGNLVGVTSVVARTDPKTGNRAFFVKVSTPRGWDQFSMPAEEFAVKYQLEPNGAMRKEIGDEWMAAFDAVPKDETADVHLISGALLPLWKSIRHVTYSKVARAITDDGQRVIGMEISPADIGGVLQTLGVAREFKNPADVHAAVAKGEMVVLEGGLKLRKVRVHSQPRIEVAGVGPERFGRFRAIDGLIEERIDFRPRFFVPLDEGAGVPVLARILEAFPVLSGEPPVTREMARRAAPGQRGMFAEDVPLPEPKRPEPKQGALFAGRDMLVPSAARTTEGREADGPLFRQEQDARDRAEERSQGDLFGGSREMARVSGFGPRLDAELTRITDEAERLADEIDAGYEAGRDVADIEQQYEALQERLENIAAEFEHDDELVPPGADFGRGETEGGNQVGDRASVEEQLGNLYFESVVRPDLARIAPEYVMENARAVLRDAQMGGMSPSGLRDVSDDEIRAAMKDAYERRRSLHERLRQRVAGVRQKLRAMIREDRGPGAIDRVREGDKRGARAGQFIVASPDPETREAAKKVAATLGRNFLPALDRAFRGLAKAAGVDRAKLLGLTLDRRVTANVTGNAVRLNLFAARADSSVERGLYHAAVHELAHIVTEQRAKADPAFAARLDDGGHGEGYAEVLAELQAKLRPERRGWLRTIGAALSAEDGRARKMIDETWQADVAPAWRLIRAREAGRGGPRGLGRPRGDGDGAGEGGPRPRARDAAGGAAGGVRSGEPVRGGRVEAASGVRPGAAVQRGGPGAERPAGVAATREPALPADDWRQADDETLAEFAEYLGHETWGTRRGNELEVMDEFAAERDEADLRYNERDINPDSHYGGEGRDKWGSDLSGGRPATDHARINESFAEFLRERDEPTRELRRRQRADAPEGPAAEAAGVVGRMRRNRRATGARWIAELRRRGVDHDPLFRWLDQRGTVRVTRDEILAYLDPVDRPRTEPGHPSGEPPMVGERVESMREAERAVDAPPAELDRQTRATWASKDPALRSMLRTMSDGDFYAIMESRRLNEIEVQAWGARVAYKKERADAAAEALAAARADGGDTLEAERAHLEATMDYIRAERAMVNDGTGAARALAARRRLMQASRLDDDEFLRSLFRDLPNASDAQVADIVRAWRTDPQAVPDLLRAAIGYDTLDKALEVWKAGLLSAPSTDIANLTGNAGEAGARIAEGVVAAGVDRLLSMFGGTTRARRLEEAGAEVAGLIDVFPGAASKLLADLKGVVKDGDRWFPDKQIGASGRWERDVGAVGGVGGRLARTSFRKLDVEDQFFKTLAGAGVLRKLAMRRARQALGEAASAEAVRARAAEIVEEALSPTSPRHADLLQEVEKEKLSRTFQDDPGRLGSDLIRLARDNRLVAVIFPFIKTPANILKITLQRSPLGYGEAKRRYDAWRKAIAEGAGAAEVRRLQGEAADAIARPLLGTTLLAGFAALAQAGAMTGGGPTDSNEERLLRDSGWQPYSFVFRDGEGRRYYVPYNRFEPVSTIFGYAADLIEIKDEKKAGDMLDKAVGSLAANLVNKTYLQGLSDAANLIAKPSQFASRYLSNLTGSLVPNIVARAARGIDPTLRDTTPEKTGLAGIPERATKTVLSRIPGLTGLVPERASALGDPVQRQGSAFSRFGLPVQMSVEEPGSLERELLAADYAPQAPGRDVTINRQRVRLTDEEYDILLRYRRAAAARVGEIVKMGSFQRRPEDDRRRVLQGVFRDYGDRAREQAKARARARLARERSVRPAQPTAGV